MMARAKESEPDEIMAEKARLRLRVADIMSGACGEDADSVDFWINAAQLPDVIGALISRLYPEKYPACWTTWQFMGHYDTVETLTDFLWDQGLRPDGTIATEA